MIADDLLAKIKHVLDRTVSRHFALSTAACIEP
jgi:hypothetical protein